MAPFGFARFGPTAPHLGMAQKFTSLLVQDKIVGFRQMDAALRRQQQLGGRVATALLELGETDEGVLLYFLSKSRQLPAAEPSMFTRVDPDAVGLLPVDEVERLGAFPLEIRAGTLKLAVLDPLDRDIVQELARRTDLHIQQFISLEFRFLQALEVFHEVAMTDRYRKLAERLPLAMGWLPDKPRPVRRAAPAAPSRPQVEPPAFRSDDGATPGLNWSLPQLSAFFGASDSRDESLLAALGFVGKFFRRRMLLIVGRDRLRGFAIQGVAGLDEAFEGVEIPFASHPELPRLCRGGSYFFGPPGDAGLDAVYASLGIPVPPDAMVVPVAIKSKAALLLVGDGEGAGLNPKVLPVVFLLANQIAATLERLIRDRKGKGSDARKLDLQVARAAAAAPAPQQAVAQGEQIIAAVADREVARGLNEIPTDGWDLPDLGALGFQVQNIPLPTVRSQRMPSGIYRAASAEPSQLVGQPGAAASSVAAEAARGGIALQPASASSNEPDEADEARALAEAMGAAEREAAAESARASRDDIDSLAGALEAAIDSALATVTGSHAIAPDASGEPEVASPPQDSPAPPAAQPHHAGPADDWVSGSFEPPPATEDEASTTLEFAPVSSPAPAAVASPAPAAVASPAPAPAPSPAPAPVASPAPAAVASPAPAAVSSSAPAPVASPAPAAVSSPAPASVPWGAGVAPGAPPDLGAAAAPGVFRASPTGTHRAMGPAPAGGTMKLTALPSFVPPPSAAPLAPPAPLAPLAPVAPAATSAVPLVAAPAAIAPPAPPSGGGASGLAFGGTMKLSAIPAFSPAPVSAAPSPAPGPAPAPQMQAPPLAAAAPPAQAPPPLASPAVAAPGAARLSGSVPGVMSGAYAPTTMLQAIPDRPAPSVPPIASAPVVSPVSHSPVSAPVEQFSPPPAASGPSSMSGAYAATRMLQALPDGPRSPSGTIPPNAFAPLGQVATAPVAAPSGGAPSAMSPPIAPLASPPLSAPVAYGRPLATLGTATAVPSRQAVPPWHSSPAVAPLASPSPVSDASSRGPALPFAPPPAGDGAGEDREWEHPTFISTVEEIFGADLPMEVAPMVSMETAVVRSDSESPGVISRMTPPPLPAVGSMEAAVGAVGIDTTGVRPRSITGGSPVVAPPAALGRERPMTLDLDNPDILVRDARPSVRSIESASVSGAPPAVAPLVRERPMTLDLDNPDVLLPDPRRQARALHPTPGSASLGSIASVRPGTEEPATRPRAVTPGESRAVLVAPAPVPQQPATVTAPPLHSGHAPGAGTAAESTSPRGPSADVLAQAVARADAQRAAESTAPRGPSPDALAAAIARADTGTAGSDRPKTLDLDDPSVLVTDQRPAVRPVSGAVRPLPLSPSGAQGAVDSRGRPLTLDIESPGVMVGPRSVIPLDREIAEIQVRAIHASNAELVELLSAPQPKLAETALAELIDRGPKAVGEVMAAFPGPLRISRKALDSISRPPEDHGPIPWLMSMQLALYTPRLVPLLGDPSPDKRFYATFLLQKAFNPDLVVPMSERVFDDEEAIRSMALKIIEYHRSTQHFQRAMQTIRSKILVPDPPAQATAIHAVTTLRDDRCAGSLIQLLDHPSEDMRTRALRALMKLTFEDLGTDRRKWDKWFQKSGSDGRNGWILAAMVHREWKVRDAVARELRTLPRLVVNYNPDLDRPAQLRAQAAVQRYLESR